MSNSQKSECERSAQIPNFPKPDKKKRISMPSKEWNLFLDKNKIESPKGIVIVPNDTAQGFWGMTEAQFEKLVAVVREKRRWMVDVVYKGFCWVKFSPEQKRAGPFSKLQKLGLINFNKGERFEILCSRHQDFEDVAYFLRFTPALFKKDKLENYIYIRERLENILGVRYPKDELSR